MSFEFKYDKDGLPETTQPQPEFVEQNTVVESEPVVEHAAETEEEQPEQLEATEEVVIEKEAEQPKKSSPQDSWKVLRQQKEQAEKRALELERALQEAQSNKQPEEDLSINIGDDDFAEGKHLSKVDKRIQKLEQQLKQYQHKSSLDTVKTQLKVQYPDWDKVFNEENLARLEMEYPELAHTLNASSDVYKSGVSAYTMIKKLGIVPEQDTYQQDKVVAQRNAAKPKPVASIAPQQGSSPLSKANAFENGLTEDLRRQLIKEMADSVKRF